MRPWLFIGAVNGFLAVAAGAFAAHGLRDRLGPDALSWFETGARYHAIHTLALIAVGLLPASAAPRWTMNLAGGGFLIGILLFCGSLYLMALTGFHGLGLITPLGGLCFLAGWAGLAILAWRTV